MSSDDDGHSSDSFEDVAEEPRQAPIEVPAAQIVNQPHDLEVEADGDDVPSPQHNEGRPEEMQNQLHDAALNVDDAVVVRTPEKRDAAQIADEQEASLRNAPHDYQVDLGERIPTPPGRAGRDPPPPPPVPSSPAESTLGPRQKDPLEASSPGAMAQLPEINWYDPARYRDLDAPADVLALFSHITAYCPEPPRVELPLKPFIPDYAPAVGEVDVFVKVPRPDGKPDGLGTRVLDEPAARQSNAPIVWIELQYLEAGGVAAPFVESVEEAIKRPLVIDNWVRQIDEVHRKAKPSAHVAYANPMPSADSLLSVWPSGFEDLLAKPGIELPPAELDVDIVEYANICCALADIPVYQKPIESLHALFSTYADFKQNVHFNSAAFQSQ